MDKQKCRVCGEKHWNHEPHVFPKEDLVSKDSYSNLKDASVGETVSYISVEGVNKKIEPPADKRKTGAKFDKVAYQREYMRKRRAK